MIRRKAGEAEQKLWKPQPKKTCARWPRRKCQRKLRPGDRSRGSTGAGISSSSCWKRSLETAADQPARRAQAPQYCRSHGFAPCRQHSTLESARCRLAPPGLRASRVPLRSNIRTGFYSAEPVVIPEPPVEEDRDRLKAMKKQKASRRRGRRP